MQADLEVKMLSSSTLGTDWTVLYYGDDIGEITYRFYDHFVRFYPNEAYVSYSLILMQKICNKMEQLKISNGTFFK